jgi:hypothetical protein
MGMGKGEDSEGSQKALQARQAILNRLRPGSARKPDAAVVAEGNSRHHR